MTTVRKSSANGFIAEPYLALDVYYHPFAYRDFSTVDYDDSRLAA
jgi:hypothetical protein